MKNKIGMIAVIVIVTLVAVSFLRDQIIKQAIDIGIHSVLGTKASIGNYSMSLLAQKVKIEELKIYNPPGFPPDVLLDMPEIKVDYDLPAFLKKELHFRSIVINLKEMIVSKNKEGKLSVDSLKIVEQKPNADNSKKEDKKEEKPFDVKMKIDKMVLTVGKVVFKDYSQSDEPVIKVYDVGIDHKEFKNITSAQQMAALIMVTSMKSTAIRGAAIYGATALLGVGFLPAAAAGVLLGNDTSSIETNKNFDTVFSKTKELIKKEGKLITENKAEGTLKSKVDGVDIIVKIHKAEKRMIKVEASARKMLIPRPELAGGFLYRLSDALK